ncbi:ribonuclease T2-like protein [Fusarium oxysporum]|uniref:ribonuclease T2 n=1 Tax=Fusarium oxysporum TaxID=5507 RepID=A0A420MUK3_FUSOX|nr:ribonuclease T2-like protein [Fusarium oxysporum]RKK71687.1 Ribonuclease Trv [Fusarium oxysporum]
MTFIKALIPLALYLAGVQAKSCSAGGKPTAEFCSKDLPLSCHNTTAVEDTCCFIPAGQLLQTQFWDSDPVAGPHDSWTIHGLWPDYCDGTYPQFCDKSREYTNIKDLVTKFLGKKTVSYMDKYWVSQDGNDESLWEHEFNKHGTCISTLEPSCYTNYETGAEAADYVKKTISLFKTLPTYKWLAEAGIKPSKTKTYTADEIVDALAEHHGARVTIGCSNGSLSEVWYHFNVKGSLQDGQFVSSEPDGSKSSCPDSGIQYAPKK